ncbi:hypothetical protein [Nonomuraea sp. NPDC052265]|uniref:hypothetical protein n=1 Tax=Nonomuraea sp. NPDC052265 TaxID=3364374 RepID=UPI0037C58787
MTLQSENDHSERLLRMGFLGGEPDNMDAGAQGMAGVHSNLKGLIPNVSNSLRAVAAASEGLVPEAATSAAAGYARTAGHLTADVDYLGRALKAMAANLRKTMGGE